MKKLSNRLLTAFALSACAMAANAYTEDFQPTGAGGAVATGSEANFTTFVGGVGSRFPNTGATFYGYGNGSEKLNDEATNQFVRLNSDGDFGFDQLYITLSLSAGYYDFSFDFRSSAASALSFNLTQTSPSAGSLFSSVLGSSVGDPTENQLTGWATYSSPTGIHLSGGTYKLAWKDGLKDTFSTDIDNINVSVSAVPEPETYAMMLAGLAAVGFMALRRKLS